MAKDILELGADVYDDTVVTSKRRMSPKKRNYIIGLSITGAALIGAITFAVVAANTFLLDYSNIENMSFIFSTDSEEKTATLYKLSSEVKYPSTFRIPSKVNGYKVTGVAENAFNGHTEIKKIVMTDNITKIGEKAFYGCTNLKSFKWSKNLIDVGNDAFLNTEFYTNLTKDPNAFYDLPSGVLIYVGNDYFKANTALVSDSVFNDASKKADIETKYGATNILAFSSLNVKKIASGAIKNNDKIVYLDMPNSFDEVCDSTFYNCSSLKAIDFSNSSITTIESYAFSSCENLTNITLSDKLTSIGQEAFAEAAITAVPDISSVTSFGSGVFKNCKNLEEVVYPVNENLTKVPADMFNGCSSLKSIKWGDASNSGINFVKTIETGAFAETAFTEFTIPQNVSVIQDETFKNCTQLKEVKMWANDEYTAVVEEEDEDDDEDEDTPSGKINNAVRPLNATIDVTGVTLNKAEASLLVGDELQLTATVTPNNATDQSVEWFSDDETVCTVDKTGLVVATGAGETIVSVTTNDGFFTAECVVTVSDYFYGYDGNRYPGVAAGVNSIRSSAFNGCTSLDTISLYKTDGSVYEREEGVFYLPMSLVKTDASSSILNDDNYTFAYTKAKMIFFRSNLMSVGSYSFYNMKELTTVIIPNTTKLIKIGSSAFEGDDKLELISLPNRMTSIGPSVFKDCASLDTLTLPTTGITSISAKLFMNASSLPNVTIPETVTVIKEDAFNGASGLNYVIIPSSVNTINARAFTNNRTTAGEKMPIYLNIYTTTKTNFDKAWHDDTVEIYYLLADGAQKIDGYKYWNGDTSSPAEI